MTATLVLVPREPTEAMLEAAQKALRNHLRTMPQNERVERYGHPKKYGYIVPPHEKHAIRYRAMLEAADLEAEARPATEAKPNV